MILKLPGQLKFPQQNVDFVVCNALIRMNKNIWNRLNDDLLLYHNRET